MSCAEDERYVIEYPSAGETYSNDTYGVYKYGTHGRGSVLEGRQKRSFIAEFTTLGEAQAAYPQAEWDGDGRTQREDVSLPCNLPSWFDPAYAGEHWSEEDAY